MKNKPYIKIIMTRPDGSRSEATIKGDGITPGMIKAVDKAITALCVEADTETATWPAHDDRKKP